MINISFDRPLLLLIAIPLLLLVLIPFFIAIKKTNRSKSAVISLIIHVLVVFSVTLVSAGANVCETVTKTEVVVLADVSYSAERNLDTVDECVKRVERSLPDNSSMRVVAFGRDVKDVTAFGEAFSTVRNSGADTSGTDIKSALDYAATLFGDGVVKRVVLITDGKQTAGYAESGVVGSVELLSERGIYIDAIYVDNNLKDGEEELQITTVDLTPTTYLGLESTADVLVQSSSERTAATVRLYRDGKPVSVQYPVLTKGYNVLNFSLPTDLAGVFEYTVVIESQDSDTSFKNNSYSFTQEVAGKMSVLLITSSDSDLEMARKLYGDTADITVYARDPEIPCTVEELMPFDQIVLSEIDVRELSNVTSFIDSLDTVVSRYGKSLLTFGDLRIQNETDSLLSDLEDMLPVRFGNNDQDPKHVCIVIDISRSMEFNYKLDMAKMAAKQIVSMMSDHDTLTVVSFWGDYTTPWPTNVISGQREFIDKEVIDKVEPTQGTMLDKGLAEAYDKVLKCEIDKEQVFLISDGRSWSNESDSALVTASELKKIGVPVSVINIGTELVDGDDGSGPAVELLTGIAEIGGGDYYFAKNPSSLTDVVLSELSDDVTESIVEKTSPVSVRIPSDPLFSGIEGGVPSVDGFVYANAKKSATTPLTTEFTKSRGGVSFPTIYSYWDYGKGLVASFTSSLSGSWTASWQNGVGEQIFLGIISENIPERKHSYPFTLTLSHSGSDGMLSVVPETLSFDAKAVATVTFPSGKTLTEELLFDSKGYELSFNADELGRYLVSVSYELSGRSYSAMEFMSVPYHDEYNSFTVFNVSDLHRFIRTRGSVFFEDEELKLENREEDVATYTYYLTVPLMIAAVALYVVDIIIRKLTWTDIRNLFGLKERKKLGKGGGAK